MQWDLIIVGAGPAGMSAALAAEKLNLRVLVLDRQDCPGGQIFRDAGRRGMSGAAAIGADYTKGRKLVQEFEHSSVEFRNNATVWHLVPGRVLVSRDGKSEALACKQLLIASGAMERPVPVPGWTLPGVLGAGAADLMLKSSSLMPKGPVILCGNGPLIIQTAAHLKEFKIPVAGIVLTNSFSNVFRAAPRLLGGLLRPGKLFRGMAMTTVMLFGQPCKQRARDLAISRSGEGFSVEFNASGKQQSLRGDNVLLHGGVISETRITRLMRCRHVWEPLQRYWHVETDYWGRTSVAGVRVAGDCAGVRGADAAMDLGRLATLDAACELGVTTLEERDATAGPSLRRMYGHEAMRRLLDALFAPAEETLVPKDEAVVCRCEELTAGELRKAVLEGCWSLDGLKAQARPGMGMCQGRTCGPGAAEIIAQAAGVPLERLPPHHAQMPLFPVRLRELTQMALPPDGL